MIAKSTVNSTSLVRNALVHNPIYDGPLYESIQQPFETLTATVQRAATGHTSESSNESLILEVAEDSRYVAQPNHSTLPQQGSHSPSSNAHTHQLSLKCLKEPLPYTVLLTDTKSSQRNNKLLPQCNDGTGSECTSRELAADPCIKG